MAIQKVIHQFWIGQKKMPTDWMKTWQDKNPLLKYVLCNEYRIDKFGLKYIYD